MTTTPLPPPDTHCFDDDTQTDVWSYSAPLAEQIVKQARADLEAENARLRKIAWLIGSIFVHGNFKAETSNERELETLLRENGTFWESLADFDARAALESKQ